MIIEIKSATITGKGQIAIPKQLRQIKGFEIGAKIAIIGYKDRIEIRSMEQINEKMFGALASEKSLAKDWNSKEDEKTWRDL